MIRKSTQALLSVASIVAGMAMPAFAQSATPSTVEKSQTNATFQRKPMQFAHKSGGYSKGKFSHGRSHGYKKHGGTFSSLKGEFALTTDQYEKLFAIKNQFREQAAPKFAELKADGRKMRDLMSQPSVDKSQVLSLQDSMNSAREALGTIMLESKLQQLSVLTPAQRTELRKKFVEHSVNSRRS